MRAFYGVKILIAFLLASLGGFGQYVQFSQFYAAPTVLGPSFTGLTESSRINTVYRDQWAKLPGVFRTYALGYDINVPRISSGFGVLILNDVAGKGNLRRTEFGVLYSWYGLINKTYEIYFRPGVEFKLTQRAVDLQNLVFPSHIKPDGTLIDNPVYPQPIDINKLSVDAAASAMVYSPVFWAGFTVDHLFRPSDGFYDPGYKTPIKVSVYGGYKWNMTKGRRSVRRSSTQVQDWFFVAFHYRYMDAADQMDIGGYWQHDPITIGVWIRGLPYLNMNQSKTIDAFIAGIGYKIFNFTIGYSYDLPVNQLLAKVGGTHEISLIYNFAPSIKSRKKYGPIPCPRL